MEKISNLLLNLAFILWHTWPGATSNMYMKYQSREIALIPN